MPAFDPSLVDVYEFFEVLDIPYEEGDPEARFLCPFGNHDGDDLAATINTETTAWICHKCHASGNILHFTERFLGVSPIKARSLLKERWGKGYVDPDARSARDEVAKIFSIKTKQQIDQPFLDDSQVDRFHVDWEQEALAKEGHAATDYIFERGFHWTTLEEWEFGYDPYSDRLTFAVRDENGQLIGFKARVYDDRKPRYLVLGDKPNRAHHYGFPCYHTGQVIYGLHSSKGELVLCEGELNAVALHQAGFQGVAINGSNFTPKQSSLIRERADAVTLFLDSDSAGRDATLKIVELLGPFLQLRIAREHEGDPASMKAEEIAEIIGTAQGQTSWLSDRKYAIKSINAVK